MPQKSIEQFDVLSNTLRLLPEQILRLPYFIKEIDDPEEGIANVEVACVNVLNNIYGMMCSLKAERVVNSIYEHDAITTVLCIRHILQHQSGRMRNNLRDTFHGCIKTAPILIKYNFSDNNMLDLPFYISVHWLQEGIASSNNANRLKAINEFWRFDQIRSQVEESSRGSWQSTYVCAMALITEAVRKVLFEYGSHFEASGFDSNVYHEHFSGINPINTNDYGIIT